MRKEGTPPNVFTYSTLVKKAPDYDEAKALVDAMREEGVQPNAVTYNTLVDKAFDYNEATACVYRMRKGGIPPDIFTYNTLIKKASDYDEAKALMNAMRKEGTQPNVFTYSELVDKAPDYEEAKALVNAMRKEDIQPNVFTYNTLIKKAPDYEGAKALVDTMREEGVPPNVYIYNTLFKKDLSGVLADDILKWYLAQKNHPEQPIQAVIASYRKIHCLDQALRLALDYPHLQAARKLIREHETEALSYFRMISDHDPQHPNAEYALGIALMELEQELEAETHFKKALKLATAEPRQAGIKRLLRQIDGKRSHRR
jgi:pentatricopeptide repeat protein